MRIKYVEKPHNCIKSLTILLNFKKKKKKIDKLYYKYTK